MNKLYLNPTEKVLLRTLRSAEKAANAKISPAFRVKVSPKVFAKVIAEAMESAEGFHYFRSGSTSQYYPRGLIVVAWWSDALGRKHVRIVGRNCHSSAQAYRDDPTMPAVAHVYPNAVIGIGNKTLVVCGCGAVGTEKSIAWMGECCGPCHDRKEEGRPIPPPMALEGFGLAAPTPDGRGVIQAFHFQNKLRYTDLATGEFREVKLPLPFLEYHTFSPDGTEITLGMGTSRVRWNWAVGKPVRAKAKPAYGMNTHSPDGKWVAESTGDFRAIDWDKTGNPLGARYSLPRINVDRFQVTPYLGGRFTPDGRWIGLTREGTLEMVELPSLTTTPLRTSAQTKLGRADYFSETIIPEILDMNWDADLVCLAFRYGERELLGPLYVGSIRSSSEWTEVKSVYTRETIIEETIRFTPDGRWLVMVDASGLALYPVTGGKPVVFSHCPSLGHCGLSNCTFSPDGELLYATMSKWEVNEDHTLRLPWRELMKG